MPTSTRSAIAAVVFAVCLVPAIFPQANSDSTEPFPPHRIAGNLYYVGSRGLASYLITTPKGHVLINSSLESSVPLIATALRNSDFI